MKARQFAKKYPKIHKEIILEISRANGFSPSEIREYHKAIRGLPEQMARNFGDTGRVFGMVVFSSTSQGKDFWWGLSDRLEELP